MVIKAVAFFITNEHDLQLAPKAKREVREPWAKSDQLWTGVAYSATAQKAKVGRSSSFFLIKKFLLVVFETGS